MPSNRLPTTDYRLHKDSIMVRCGAPFVLAVGFCLLLALASCDMSPVQATPSPTVPSVSNPTVTLLPEQATRTAVPPPPATGVPGSGSAPAATTTYIPVEPPSGSAGVANVSP